MKQAFNFALVLDDQEISQDIIEFAQRKFKRQNRGYLLAQFGDASLPHITLCQFNANDEEHAQRIAKACSALELPRSIVFDQIYFRPKPDLGPNIYNVGLLIRHSNALMNVQHKVSSMIVMMNGEPLTKSGPDYWPHMTMAYVEGKNFRFLPGDIDECSAGGKAVHPVVGLRDNAGQLKNILP